MVESQPIHKDCQEYKVIDAALGIIERGRYQVADSVAELPWLPNGPIALQVTWIRPALDDRVDVATSIMTTSTVTTAAVEPALVAVGAR